MRDNLRLYRKILAEMEEFLPDARITRVRNMALLVTGLFLAESVRLASLAKKLSLSGRVASLTGRLRRFLKNSDAEASRFYRPVVRTLLSTFEPWQEVRLLLDTTKVGFDHRVLTASLAYRKRALPLCWSIHAGPERTSAGQGADPSSAPREGPFGGDDLRGVCRLGHRSGSWETVSSVA